MRYVWLALILLIAAIVFSFNFQNLDLVIVSSRPTGLIPLMPPSACARATGSVGPPRSA